MVRRWAPPDGKWVLDVGCGVGMYTAAFLRETPTVYGIEVDRECALKAAGRAAGVALAGGEGLPFPDAAFDIVFSHEVLEHTLDDRICAEEMARVTRRGGRIVVFVPNRLYPFETHGVYWRGRYRFGNVPFVNWLPNRLRNRLAPHVRAYTARDLDRLFEGLSVRCVHRSVVFPGYDNVTARARLVGEALRTCSYALEHTPLRGCALSHFWVAERT
jgi:SAM-dependent methyltransferase